jgi:hypothetical protein
MEDEMTKTKNKVVVPVDDVVDDGEGREPVEQSKYG